MNRQPDKIFRDKLHGYQRPVPPGVWQRISHTKDSNTRRKYWPRVAAAILILATTGILLFSVLKNEPRELVSDNINSHLKTEDTISNGDRSSGEAKLQKEPLVEETIPPVTTEQKLSADQHMRKPADKTIQKKERVQTIPAENIEMPVIALEEIDAVNASIETAQLELASTRETSPEVRMNPTTERVTIIFSAEEVNEKYLIEKTNSEATSLEKESSTLKKLLAKAYDIKHNQDPIGDLRQKKNEILALNFRSDKQRTEND